MNIIILQHLLYVSVRTNSPFSLWDSRVPQSSQYHTVKEDSAIRYGPRGASDREALYGPRGRKRQWPLERRRSAITWLVDTAKRCSLAPPLLAGLFFQLHQQNFHRVKYYPLQPVIIMDLQQHNVRAPLTERFVTAFNIYVARNPVHYVDQVSSFCILLIFH